jgi:hypothetical protein
MRRYGRHASLAVFCCAVLMTAPAGAHVVAWSRVATTNGLPTSGQLCTNDGNFIVCDTTTPTIASGLVGIGTTSPNNILNVYGDGGSVSGPAVFGINATDASSASHFVWGESVLDASLAANASVAYVIGQAASAANSGYLGFHYVGADSTSNYLTLGMYGSDNLMVVTDSGNVGIGTTNPVQTLSVAGNLGFPSNVALTAPGYPVFANVSGYGLEIASTNFAIATGGTTTLNFVINSSGQVGIGSTGPIASLDLSQKTDAVALPVGLTSNRPTGVNGMIRYNSALPGLEAYVNGVWSTVQSSGTTSGILGVANGGTGTGTTFTQGSIVFAGASGIYTQNNANFFWDNTNDRLGIGTTSPAWQLEVRGAGTNTAALDGVSGTGGSLFLHDTSQVGGSGGAIIFGGNAATAVFFAGIKGLLTNGGNGSNNATGDIAFSTRNAVSDAALTERMRIMSTGNVGIGTTGPNALLQLEGGSATYRGTANVTAIFNAGNASTNDAGILLGSINGNTPFIEASQLGNGSAPAGLTFRVNGAEYVRILNSGNVGIGTTTPTQALQVGLATPSAATPYSLLNGLRISGGDTTNTIWQATGALTINTNGTNLSLGYGNGVEALTILGTNGNVGIGTTSPASRLHVYDGGNSIGTIQLGATGTTGYYSQVYQNANYLDLIANGDTAYRQSLATNNGTGNIRFFTAGFAGSNTERMRIDWQGNVGIGTTLPSKTLDVVASGNTDPSTGGLVGIGILDTDTSTTTQSGITFRAYDDGNTSRHGAALVMGKEGDWTAGSGNYPSFLSLWTRPTGGSGFEYERMRITSTGNVGIGTTGPANKLDILGGSGGGGVTDLLALRHSSPSGTGDGPGLLFTANLAGGQYNLGRVEAFNAGAVGSGYAGSMQLLVKPADGNETGALSPAMTLLYNGNVGIGTTAPTFPLQIISSGNAQLNVFASSGDMASIVLGGAPSFSNRDYSSMIRSISNAASNYGSQLVFYTHPTASNFSDPTERMRIDYSGNVGIGTTSPGAVLDIEQTSGTTTLLNAQNTSVAGTEAATFQTVNTAAGGAWYGDTPTVAIYNHVNSVDSRLDFGARDSGGNSHVTSRIAGYALTGGTGGLKFYTRSNSGETNPRMLIDTAGNVGIGTTGPVVSLDLSQKTDALALPVGATSNRPTGVNGMMRYNQTIPALEAYISGAWNSILTGGGNLLGTSTTAANPQISGDPTSGFYTAGAAKVDVTISGTQIAEWNSGGYNVVSGKVGIGTTGPQTLLAVADGGANGFEVDPVGATPSTYVTTYSRTSSAYTPMILRASTFSFLSGGATQGLYQNASGNVGIGTTGPGAQAHIYGAGTTNNYYANGDAVGGALYLQDSGSASSNGGEILFGALQGVFASIKGITENGTGPAGALIFGTRNLSGNVIERMRVDYNGYVGIGTTVPAQALDVAGNIQFAGGGHLISNSGTLGPFVLDAGSNGFHFRLDTALGNPNAYTEPMTIISSGNVGIGTTGPGALLQVGSRGAVVNANNSTVGSFGALSTGGISYPLTLANTAAATVGNETQLTFIDGTGWSATSAIGSVVTNASSAASDLRFLIYSGSALNEAMRIQGTTGNVGIGTTGPSAKLEINHDDAVVSPSGSNIGSINLTHPTSGGQSLITFKSTVNWPSDGGYIAYYDEAAQYAYWGTSAENSALVLGVTNDLQNTASDVVVLKSPAAAVIDSPSLLIPSGNVGIGTTAPQGILDVRGVGLFGPYESSGVYNANAQLYVRASGDVHEIIESIGVNTAGFATNANGLFAATQNGGFHVRTGISYSGDFTSTGSEALTVLSGGNVGIGTTVPTAKLTIQANGACCNSASGQILIEGASNTAQQLQIVYDTAADLGYIQAVHQGVAFEPLVLNPNGGNVGIGMTNPATRLHVGTRAVQR